MSAHKEPLQTPTRGFNRPLNLQQTSLFSSDRKAARLAALEERFRDALDALPPPGAGCHPALFGAANLGVLAGLPDADIEARLRQAIKPGSRKVPDQEIRDAVAKARSEAGHQGIRQSSQGLPVQLKSESEIVGKRLADDPDKAREIQAKLIAAGGGSIAPESADLWEASSPHPTSPLWVDWLKGHAPCADMLLLLSELFRPTDMVYIGSGKEKGQRQADHIKPAAKWIEFFSEELDGLQHESSDKQRCRLRKLAINYPFFVANPLAGKPNAAGSYRSGANVETFRYALVEADTIPRLDKQLALLNGLRLPIVSLVYSGGKSIHALIDTAKINGGKAIASHVEWQKVVKQGLFIQIKSLGFDGSTSDITRLTRLPGIIRFPPKIDENGSVVKNEYGNEVIDYDNWTDARFQTLLYINRKGGALCLK